MQVKVWNDNVHPYREKFKNKSIEIPPHDFIEMEYHEAVYFLGTMPPNIQTDAGGTQKPISYKMLRIEKPGQATEDPPVKKGRSKGVTSDTSGHRDGGKT